MIQMPDSTIAGNLPMGYPAYLGYADGNWPTGPRLPQLFPGAKIVRLTVNGSTLDQADGVDCEPGNIDAKGSADWVRRKLAAAPSFLPVVYADLASEGYSMSEVLAELAKLGIGREKVRLLSAHYDGEHVCSPERGCRDARGNVITWTADGTQWTSRFPGINGSEIDMSLLSDGFFGGQHISVWALAPSQVTSHSAVVDWQHTGGVSQWEVFISGPRFTGVANTVSRPQAVFSGLAPDATYTVRVTSLVEGKPAGVTGIKSFRTAAA